MKKLFSLLNRRTLEKLGILAVLVLLFCNIRALTQKQHSFEAVPYANSYNAPAQDLSLRSSVNPAAPLKTQAEPGKKLAATQTIELTPANTVSIRAAITDDTISSALSKMLKISAKLPTDQPIYLVLDTPGGSVQAGLQFIDSVQALPQKVHTISIFAASMGFHIAQYLGDRMMTPSGTMMSHRMRGGIEGQIPGELNVRSNMLLDLADEEDDVASRRMGLTLPAYRSLIQDEYWASPRRAIKDHAADRVVLIHCSVELAGSKDAVSLPTPFGNVTIVYNGCPSVESPDKIELPKLMESSDRSRVTEYVDLLLRDRKKFVEEYIVTGKFDKLLK